MLADELLVPKLNPGAFVAVDVCELASVVPKLKGGPTEVGFGAVTFGAGVFPKENIFEGVIVVAGMLLDGEVTGLTIDVLVVLALLLVVFTAPNAKPLMGCVEKLKPPDKGIVGAGLAVEDSVVVPERGLEKEGSVGMAAVTPGFPKLN